MKELELRMYFFVPYNLSPIQQAIQAGHAALEYARKYKDDKQFVDFADNWKTWIILNGGTTNNTSTPVGTLNEISFNLIVNEIKISQFNEPDLNDALTAVCFIADERVFNYEDYPDFKEYCLTYYSPFPNDDKKLSYESLKGKYASGFIEWSKMLGGNENVFLRELLKGKKLA